MWPHNFVEIRKLAIAKNAQKDMRRPPNNLGRDSNKNATINSYKDENAGNN